MKSDIQLKCDVEEELQWDPAVDADRFAVAVKNGVVTISGGIDTFAGKHAVEAACGGRDGARRACRRTRAG